MPGFTGCHADPSQHVHDAVTEAYSNIFFIKTDVRFNESGRKSKRKGKMNLT